MPLCGTTWWGAQHVMVIVKQGKIIITAVFICTVNICTVNSLCLDNNDNLHPSSYQKLWHKPQNVLAAYGANPMSFFYMYASRHLFSFGTIFALPLGLKAIEVPSLTEAIKEVAFAVFSFLFSFSSFCAHHFSIFSQILSLSLSGRAFDM